MSIISLTGNFGYDLFYVRDLEAYSVIDATNASWIVSNSANQYPDADTSYLDGLGQVSRYPFIVYSAGYGLTIKGGAIWGEVPQYSDWQYTYNDSAAIRIDSAPGATISDWRIDKAWDGIRFRNDSADFLVDDTYFSNIRDDAIENDLALSGTVRDSLFDGVFVGISLTSSTNPDASGNTMTFEHVMMRSKSYLYEGEMTHGAFFKMNTSAPEKAPSLRLINSVFAIEDVTPIHIARLKLAWANVVESHGNVFLNLSDTPLPAKYPKPPAGFTILEGQEARDYWEACKAAWIDNHDGTPVSDITALPLLPGALPPLPETQPPLTEEQPIVLASNDTYYVNSTQDIVTEAPDSGIDLVISTISYTLPDNVENLRLEGTANLNGYGNDLDNLLIANSGKNLLNGMAGADTMRGLEGDDIYVVDNASDVVQEAVNAGNDTVQSSVSYALNANVEQLVLTGLENLDGTGNALDNVVIGNAGNNNLVGSAGDDRLHGESGQDTLTGGAGRDVMYGGPDRDVDIFVYTAITESTVGRKRDLIYDFVSGVDRIDLRQIDANTTMAGDQSFAFSRRGEAAHSIWIATKGGHSIVRGDVDGDHSADFEIQIMNVKALGEVDMVL